MSAESQLNGETHPLQDLYYMPNYLGQPAYPGGFPFYWRQENWQGTGADLLRKAVPAYYTWKVGEGPEPDKDCFEVIRQFLIYHIYAPMWELNPFDTSGLEMLREHSLKIKDWKGIDEHIELAMDIGIDPL